MTSKHTRNRSSKAGQTPGEPIPQLFSALRRLDALLAARVAEFQTAHAAPPDPYGGLYIAPDEVESGCSVGCLRLRRSRPRRAPITQPDSGSRLVLSARRCGLGPPRAASASTSGGGALSAGEYHLVKVIRHPAAGTLQVGEYRLASGVVVPVQAGKRMYLPLAQR